MTTPRERSRVGRALVLLAFILSIGGFAAGSVSGLLGEKSKRVKAAAKTEAQTGAPNKMREKHIVIGTYAADSDALYWILVMVESLRAFGGDLRDVPIWIYLPDDEAGLEKTAGLRPVPDGVTFRRSNTPAEAKTLFYAGKVFAAALAEADAVGRYQLLAYLDPDVIFTKEPRDFLLPDSVSLGYRPVMHKLIGSRLTEPPDEFWKRVYDRLEVASSAIFPMKTPVDQETIRAYFNAGLLIVRPEMGVLRKWPACFATLYTDSVFVVWCKQDRKKAIFLHQVALTGAILSTLKRHDMIELPETYNYALFLQDKYPANKRPRSVDDVILFRHEFVFSDPAKLATIRNAGRMYPWVKERLPKHK